MTLGLALCTALCTPTFTAQAQEPETYANQIEQARFFVRKQWFDDAIAELERAVASPEGRMDPEAWYLLATVRYELVDLEGARQAASRAHSFSHTADQLQQASGFNQFLQEQFGVVEVRGEYAGLSSGIEIELESVIFDPSLKLFLNKVEALHAEPRELPRRIGLPVGTYRINGEQITLTPGSETELVLGTSQLQAKGPGAVQLATIELSAGVGQWFSPHTSNHLPSPMTQLAVSQPIGHMVLGVMVDWAPQLYRTVDGDLATALSAWSLGGRVGANISGAEPLFVRPSVGYRYGYVPGIEKPCSDQEGAFACGQDQAADLMVYAVARAHVVLGELSIDYIDRGGSVSLGFGFKLVGEHAWAVLPEVAEAALQGGAVSYRVNEAERPMTAVGARALFSLTVAF